ncbi:MAG TPA: TetR family transcriptional regulator [Clostridiales bacterium]|nr:TetR family transcriptional regulator [Clostridiales bacterium]
MYKGTNPAAKRSQEWIANALVSLMQEKPLEQITVKEIMESSELARQTFYQVFDSKEDVLDYIMDTLFMEYLGHCKTQVIDNLCDAAKLFFQFFAENEPFVEALALNQKVCILQKKCKEYLQDESFLKFTQAGIHNLQEKDFASAFVTSGLVGMLVTWFKSGKALSTEELADIVCRLTNTPSSD